MDTFAKPLISYGCDVNPQKIIGVGQGENRFGSNDDVLATLGLASCVGLVAYSKKFTFMAHIDIGNCIGFNFNENGRCLHLEKLYKRVLEVKRDNPDFSELYIATVSSETFRYERKWWSGYAIKLDENINRFIEDCLSLGINVIKHPHFQSKFCAINSQNGDFYTSDGSYAIKTNIMDLSQRQWLNCMRPSEQNYQFQGLENLESFADSFRRK